MDARRRRSGGAAGSRDQHGPRSRDQHGPHRRDRDDATRRRDDATTRRAKRDATTTRRCRGATTTIAIDATRANARRRAIAIGTTDDDGTTTEASGARFGSSGDDGARRDERRTRDEARDDGRGERREGDRFGRRDERERDRGEGGSGGGRGGGERFDPDADWKCAECNNSNFSWRKSCKRCGAGKSKELKERERAAQAGWLLDGLEDTTNRIFIKGFDAASTSEDDLREVFSGIGIISRVRQRTGFPDQWPYAVRIYLDERGQKKDEAVITYDDPHAAQSAPSFYDGYEFNGKKLHVSIAQSKPKSAPPPSSGGGGGGGAAAAAATAAVDVATAAVDDRTGVTAAATIEEDIATIEAGIATIEEDITIEAGIATIEAGIATIEAGIARGRTNVLASFDNNRRFCCLCSTM